MHICFISHEYPLWATGGIGTFIQTFGRELVRCGHEVSVVGIGTGNISQQIDDQGVELYRLPFSKLRYVNFIPNVIRIRSFLRELHSRKPIDVVETSEAGMAFMAKNTPYVKVIRLHGGHHFFAQAEKRSINWWKGWQEKRSFKNSDAFIAGSEYVKSHTAKYLSYNNKHVDVVPLPLDEQLFHAFPNETVIPRRLVFAGTVCEKKGVKELLLSLPKVVDRFPDVHLDLYGRDWYDKNGNSYIEFLKNSMPEVSLKHATFHGPINRDFLPKLFASAELCVFPSHMETFGLVAPEAMLTGRPVLFSITGPGPEIISHQKTGLLCNPVDSNDVADKIIFALDNPLFMNEIALEGLSFAKGRFNLKTIVDKNLRLYNNFIKSKGNNR